MTDFVENFMNNASAATPHAPIPSRDSSIDIARGIGIILVIVGHIASIAPSWQTFISTFHMPFFFIMSGLLLCMKHEETRSMRALVKRKLRTIMLPYLFFSVADVLFFFIYTQLSFMIFGDPIPPLTPFFEQNLIYTLTLFGISVLWFLPALFGAELVFLVMRKNVSNLVTVMNITALTVIAYFGQTHLNTPEAAAALGTSALFFHALIRMIYGSFFVMIGYEWHLLQEHFSKKQHDTNSVLNVTDSVNTPTCTRALITFVIGLCLMIVGSILGFINGPTDLRSLYILLPYLYFPAAILMSIGLILICKSFSGVSDFILFRICQFYGRETLTVMCTHLDWYLLYLGSIFAAYAIKLYPIQALRLTVHTGLITGFVLVLEFMLICIKNQLKKKLFTKKSL